MMKYFLTILLFFSAWAHAANEAIKPELTMGFVPSRSVHEIQLTSKKLADYLSEKTGYKIKAITLSDYAGVAVAMKSRQVDFAFVGPLNYLVINQHVPVHPITAAVRNGKKGYYGLVITSADSGIERLEDLKGKSFIFGDRLSASASLYPRAAMLKAGVNPEQDLKSLTLSSQTAIVMSVLKGKADAGAIYDDARTNPEVLRYAENILDKTRIIYRSELIPADPQIVRDALHPEQKAALTKALLAMSEDPKAKGWLKELYGIDALVSASADEYDSLRQVAAISNPELLK
ncbi:phosphate/phosphite/phosphonate ABC transporter substrate-binding protein [Methylobacter sp.]|jgi:phosphonate transport system substrate-binding protein|uniref:phosphate/phosphite/phosphonate ABC transporter substrate-binding protein n=1 Tax=Methylobacter sp. TaxID=2051955 RepID=UPI003DA50F13